MSAQRQKDRIEQITEMLEARRTRITHKAEIEIHLKGKNVNMQITSKEHKKLN
jgi:hypothetical protein